MFNTLDLVAPQEVVIPQTWSKSARAMAKARGMSQAEVDATEADLQTFRAKSAIHADERKASDAAFEERWTNGYSKLSWAGPIDDDSAERFRKVTLWNKERRQTR